MSAHDLPPTDALQQQPTPPPTARHIPDALPAPPNIALPPNSTVWTKLYLLLHAHQLAHRAAWRVLIWRIVLIACSLLVAVPLGILTGVGLYELIEDDAYRHTQTSQPGWGQPGSTKYYIRGEEVTKQQYDYFQRTYGNHRGAVATAVPGGILTALAFIGIVWLLLRPRKPTVLTSIEEQIAAITKEHPEAVAAWGGAAVLRVPQLIEQILDMQSKDARR